MVSPDAMSPFSYRKRSIKNALRSFGAPEREVFRLFGFFVHLFFAVLEQHLKIGAVRLKNTAIEVVGIHQHIVCPLKRPAARRRPESAGGQRRRQTG